MAKKAPNIKNLNWITLGIGVISIAASYLIFRSVAEGFTTEGEVALNPLTGLPNDPINLNEVLANSQGLIAVGVSLLLIGVLSFVAHLLGLYSLLTVKALRTDSASN